MLAALEDDLDNPTPFARFGFVRMAGHAPSELRKQDKREREVAASDVPFDQPAAAGSSSDRAALETNHARVTGEASSRADGGAEAVVGEAIERARILSALEAARADLAARQPRRAEVLRLREEGRSWPQVAAAARISQATAGRDHAKALEQLRRRLTAVGVSRACFVGE